MSDNGDIILKVNDLLEMLSVTRRVQTVEDIGSEVFVLIYEGVCGDLLKDVIRSPISPEEHVHNVQSVIDSLSMDVLNISLSHISGQNIIDGNKETMYNLLEVFSGLVEFMQEELASDNQTLEDKLSETMSENLGNEQFESLFEHGYDTRLDFKLSNETDGHRKESFKNRKIDKNIDLNRETNQNYSDSLPAFNKLPLNDILKSNSDSVEYTNVSYNTSSKLLLDNQLKHQGVRYIDSISTSHGKLEESCKIAAKLCPDSSSCNTAVVALSAPSSSGLLSKWENDLVDVDEAHRKGNEDKMISNRITKPQNGDVQIGSTHGDELCKTISFRHQLALSKTELQKKVQAVHFDDYLDSSSTGQIGTLRRKFRDEEHKTRIRKELLGRTYEETLIELEELRENNRQEANKIARKKDICYQKLLARTSPTEKRKIDLYSVSGAVLTPKSLSHVALGNKDAKRSSSKSPLRKHKGSLDNNDILPELLEEFPFLHLSPTTLHAICHKGAKQLQYLSNAETSVLRQKNRIQEQIVEAERKQKILMDIAQKEYEQQQRLKEKIDRQRNQLAVRGKLRDKRVQSARIRKYYDEYQVRQRSKMLQKKTKEELVFKSLFADVIRIQKEKIRELHKYAKEQRDGRANKQQQELESIENYYRDQFAMLSESVYEECTQFNSRDKAQSLVLEQTKRALRKKLEAEISKLQNYIWKDEDDLHFRELDAERVLQNLRSTRVDAHI